MAFKPEWQSVAEGPGRPRRRRHVWQSVFERQLYKLRPALPLHPVVVVGEVPRRRTWTEQFYPSLFFESYKALATVAWLPQISERVRRRGWIEQFYPSFFFQSFYLLARGPEYFADVTAVEGFHRRRAQWQASMIPFFVSGNMPKLGVKTPSPKE